MTLPESTWVEDTPRLQAGRIFRRPLGLTERGFYWDSVFRGTATTINHFEFDLENGEVGEVFSRGNVERVWLYMKQAFPLLGSWVEELADTLGGKEILKFVVDEQRLLSIPSGEVNFIHVNSSDEAERLTRSILNAPSYIDASEDVSRLWIFRRSDKPCHVHVLFQLAHIMHDGFAITTLIRTFSEGLLSPNLPEKALPPMEERLRLHLSSEDLDPALACSKARKHWRRVIAKVIYAIRQKKLHVRSRFISFQPVQ